MIGPSFFSGSSGGGRAALLLAAVALGVSGCAKTPTVMTLVLSSESVMPVSLLRTTLARTSDLTTPAVNARISQAVGDASDRPAPYSFPLRLDVQVPPGWSGEISVTVDGMTWDNKYVAAVSGMATTMLSPAGKTEASVVLRDVVGPAGEGDAGVDAGDEPDAAAGEDTAADEVAAGESAAGDALLVPP